MYQGSDFYQLLSIYYDMMHPFNPVNHDRVNYFQRFQR